MLLNLITIHISDLQFQLVLNNFDSGIDLKETEDQLETLEKEAAPAAVTATSEHNTAKMEELKTHIKQLEAELQDAKSQTSQLSSLLEEEKL